jgi:hypothetical protein
MLFGDSPEHTDDNHKGQVSRYPDTCRSNGQRMPVKLPCLIQIEFLGNRVEIPSGNSHVRLFKLKLYFSIENIKDENRQTPWS